MKFKYPELRILVFARMPVAGQVKTRLEPGLGPVATLSLYQAMLKRVLTTAEHTDLAPMELWLAGTSVTNDQHWPGPGLAWYRRQGDSLGERMAHAARNALTRARGVVIIGTDCPALDRQYLGLALARLAQGHEVVIGPAEDGGYVLLGLGSPMEMLFRDIPWGTDRVLALSLQRLAEAGVNPALLPTLWDVDRPCDLERLASLQPPLVY